MADKNEQSRESITDFIVDEKGTAVDVRKAKSIGQLNVKVNVDVSEALTGLKAIQREAKKATQALRELEQAQMNTGGLAKILPKERVLTAEEARKLLDQASITWESSGESTLEARFKDGDSDK